MARGNERIWSKQEILEEYRVKSGPRVASRVEEVMERIDAAGRLYMSGPTVAPAFGVRGDGERPTLAIREHMEPYEARISVYPDHFAAPGHYSELRSRLLGIAKPGAKSTTTARGT